MPHHQFQLGQLVRRIDQVGAPARSCLYVIVSLVPDVEGVLRYRIKGIDPGTHEVGEQELLAASRPLATSTRTAAGLK